MAIDEETRATIVRLSRAEGWARSGRSRGISACTTAR